MLLLIISFLAGLLTILAPCTLPLLPVIVGSSLNTEGKKEHNLRKAFVIAVSLGISIILFTLLLKVSALFINIPQTTWPIISGGIIIVFGFISLFPALWERLPFVSKLSVGGNKLLAVGYTRQGFIGDVIVGASLGPVFSTCSPTYFLILAAVLPQSFFLGFVYLIAYAVGLGVALLSVAYIGQRLVSKLGLVSDTRGWFKRGLGILFILIGVTIILGFDKQLERKLLDSGLGDITKIEQKLLGLTEEKDLMKTADDTDLLPAPEIVDPSGFINTDGKPITISQFKGNHVVLLDVWTYSCINCQRTIPYIQAWSEKYKDQGLVVVGLHTPEFAFEKQLQNVESAVRDFGITYPVVLDNDYATWNAYGNKYWPRKYLINADGNIVYDHIGEGDYEKTERAIQMALASLHAKMDTATVIPTDIARPRDVIVTESSKVKSPEIYFGASRNTLLGRGVSGKVGIQEFGAFDAGVDVKKNVPYLSGTWDIAEEYARTHSPASIHFTYNAKNVYMVAASDLPSGVTVTIYKDGKVEKTIVVKGYELYTLIEGDTYGEHELWIDIPAAELDVFTFTFG